MKKYLQANINGSWEYVFCKNEREGVITTKDESKAIEGSYRAYEEFSNQFGSIKFRIRNRYNKNGTEYLAKLQEQYNFEIEDHLFEPLKDLNKLAVSKCRNIDYSYQDNFSKVWFSVQHETDLFDEGEETPLNHGSYKGAMKWLKKFEYLYAPY